MLTHTGTIVNDTKGEDLIVDLMTPCSANTLRSMSNILHGTVIARDMTNDDKLWCPTMLRYQLPGRKTAWSYVAYRLASDIAAISVRASRKDVQALRLEAWFIGNDLRRIAGRLSASCGIDTVIDELVSMPMMQDSVPLPNLLRIEYVLRMMLDGAYARSPKLDGHVWHRAAGAYQNVRKIFHRARENQDDRHTNALSRLVTWSDGKPLEGVDDACHYVRDNDPRQISRDAWSDACCDYAMRAGIDELNKRY